VSEAKNTKLKILLLWNP